MSDVSEVRPGDVPPPAGVDGESGFPAGYTRALHYVLTGEHEIHTVAGVVLRFFLAEEVRPGETAAWRPVSDREFQLAYENSLFDMDAALRNEIRPNARHVQRAVDDLAGTGGYLWSDGGAEVGVMTANGKSPEECGLDLAEVWENAGLEGGA
ncbi:hypothetical protein AAHZ94_27795 [Streptomyces sp. HSW2009]|uniref:hypothetical protein n=1 Tax=Streptomyces sp. HSW2009 TaxID=3142890 RepID=UPI0032EE2A32